MANYSNCETWRQLLMSTGQAMTTSWVTVSSNRSIEIFITSSWRASHFLCRTWKQKTDEGSQINWWSRKSLLFVSVPAHSSASGLLLPSSMKPLVTNSGKSITSISCHTSQKKTRRQTSKSLNNPPAAPLWNEVPSRIPSTHYSKPMGSTTYRNLSAAGKPKQMLLFWIWKTQKRPKNNITQGS